MKLQRLKTSISTNLSAVLLFSYATGLLVPGLETLPDDLVPWLLAGLVLMSCTRISGQEIKAIKPIKILRFYIIRFIVLPVILFIATPQLTPGLKEGVYLFALMPTGTMVAPLATILNSNVALALSVTIFSSVLAPFVVSGMFGLAGFVTLDVDILSMFLTLFWVIFGPIAIYYFLMRPSDQVKRLVQDNASLVSMVLLSLILIIILAEYRTVIWSAPIFVLKAFLMMTILIGIFFIYGWFSAKEKEDKISLALSSSFMNSALAVSLTFLYFPPLISIFIVISELRYLIILPLVKAYTSRWDSGTRSVPESR